MNLVQDNSNLFYIVYEYGFILSYLLM